MMIKSTLSHSKCTSRRVTGTVSTVRCLLAETLRTSGEPEPHQCFSLNLSQFKSLQNQHNFVFSCHDGILLVKDCGKSRLFVPPPCGVSLVVTFCIVPLSLLGAAKTNIVYSGFGRISKTCERV